MRSSGCSGFRPEKNALRMPRICSWCASVDVAIVFSASIRSLVSTSLVVSFGIESSGCRRSIAQGRALLRRVALAWCQRKRREARLGIELAAVRAAFAAGATLLDAAERLAQVAFEARVDPYHCGLQSVAH